MDSPVVPVRQVDLAIDLSELDAVRTCFETRWLTEGPFTARLGQLVAEATGSRHVVFAPNGTLGLFLALKALDLPPGGEILIPSFTFYGSASAAVFAGLTPVFVDCRRDTFNIDVADAEHRITSRTVAIMPVHIYGQSCDIAGVMALAGRHGLRVVEDAAQAFGVTFAGQQVGTFGDVGMISFFSDKIVTMGEGAALLVRDDDLYGTLRLMRNQGRPNAGTFIHPALGMNFRITDMQAAVGTVQVGKFATIVARRRELCGLYAASLAGVGDLEFMALDPRSNFVPFRMPITTARRADLEAYMKASGIETRGFFHPMHLQPMLTRYADSPLPISEQIARDGLCLPVHAGITERDVSHVVNVIRSFFGSGAV